MNPIQTQLPVSRQQIREFFPFLAPHVRKTPIVHVNATEFGLGDASLTLKLELLQHTGSFKARGAITNLLTKTVPRAGVVAASGGNHGVAVAFAARKFNVPAKIYVPTVASVAKIDRIRGYGAELVIGGERYAEAYPIATQLTADLGLRGFRLNLAVEAALDYEGHPCVRSAGDHARSGDSRPGI